jgi:hypothetical protein
MELTPVRVEFIVRAQEAIAELYRVNAEMDKVAVKGKLAGSSMATMEKSSKLAGTALLGLGSVFGLVAYESIKSAMDLQTSQTRLQVAVKNSGVSFAAAKPVIDKHAEAMTKLGFTTQDTYEALGTMTTATRSPQMALNALATTADLARYKHISLAEASKLVSRAALGQARGLADLGLAINKTIPKGASFAQILQSIEARTRNAATAFAQTSQGQLAILQARFKALTEDLGTQLLPAFNKILAWIDGPGLNALKKLGKWFSDNKPIVVAFTTALAVIWAAPKIDAMLAAMGKLVLGWQGVTVAAGEAAAAEGAASGAKMGPVTSLIRSPITAMAAIAAGVGYEFYKAGTDKGPPQKPVIGGKAGGAAMAQYQKELAAYNANQPKQNMFAYEYQNTENSAAAIGGKSLAGYGPAPLVSSATKTKKPSVAQLKKQKAGGTPVTTHTSVMLDSKVIAKATATHATHGSTLTAGKTK